jgi:hypothetical protein
MAAKPSASPGPTHQENISTWLLPEGADVGAVVACSGTVVWVGLAQADRIVERATRQTTRQYQIFLFIFSPFGIGYSWKVCSRISSVFLQKKDSSDVQLIRITSF